MFGFLSTLNGDAIKTAEVIKGGFPSHYGGRLSSIVDIRMKDGNMEELHGDISVGLISGKFNLEGPLIKDKTSFNISARRTWLDLFTTPIMKLSQSGDRNKTIFKYYFYDFNAKINHKFSDKSRLFLSSYLGKDHFKFRGEDVSKKENGDLEWGNRIFSAKWNYQLNPKIFSNTTIYKGSYIKTFINDVIPIETSGVTNKLSSKSDVTDYGVKIDLDFLYSTDHHIKFGAGYIKHLFKPTAHSSSYQNGTDDPIVNDIPTSRSSANAINAYVEDNIGIGSRVQLNVGLHIANFNVPNANYVSVQPRAAMNVQLNETSSVKFSYSHMTQFVHLLASPGIGFPNDLWVTSTDRIKPEKSIQYAAGITKSLGKGYEITLEGYYKTLKNLLEYKSGISFFTTGKDWENKVVVGNGESYGIELLIEKRIGKLTGWIGYTLSKSNRTFPDLNFGRSFPYKYDRRHDISVALTHKKSDRVDFGLVWVYGSGNTYTLGTRNYNAINFGEDSYFAESFLSTFHPVNHVEKRNNQRAPAFHRLDISVNFHKQKKRGKRTWSFGLYNAYSRQNPFQINLVQRHVDDPSHEKGELYLEQTSLLPIIPFASYSFKF